MTGRLLSIQHRICSSRDEVFNVLTQSWSQNYGGPGNREGQIKRPAGKTTLKVVGAVGAADLRGRRWHWTMVTEQELHRSHPPMGLHERHC